MKYCTGNTLWNILGDTELCGDMWICLRLHLEFEWTNIQKSAEDRAAFLKFMASAFTAELIALQMVLDQAGGERPSKHLVLSSIVIAKVPLMCLPVLMSCASLFANSRFRIVPWEMMVPSLNSAGYVLLSGCKGINGPILQQAELVLYLPPLVHCWLLIVRWRLHQYLIYISDWRMYWSNLDHDSNKLCPIKLAVQLLLS